MRLQIYQRIILSLSFLSFLFFQNAKANVLVAAASSLQPALTEIINNYQAKTLYTVALNTAASGVLARQISLSSGISIFISANNQWIDFLRDKNLLDRQNIYILGFNRLVLVKNCNNKQTKLLDARRIAVGDFAYVPAGIYAKNYLQNTGFLTSIQQRLVFTTSENQAVQYIRKDLLDMAFVYFSSLITYKKLCLVANISRVFSGDIIYRMVLLDSLKNKETLFFVDFLLSKNSFLIFEKYGISTNSKIVLDN